MGVGKLRNIAEGLIRNGRNPETPVALIRWGTLPEQETILGKLSNIADIAQSRKLKPPVIILVGEVVTLREKLNWFEALPLFGKKILVTRAREQASELSEELGELGAMAIEFPTIGILPPVSCADVDHCINQLALYDWIIFTSPNGVRFFLERVFAIGRDIRDLKGPQVWAIGPKTKEALESLKIKVDWVPPEYRAEAILDGFRQVNLKGKKILIPRTKAARDILPRELEKAGVAPGPEAPPALDSNRKRG